MKLMVSVLLLVALCHAAGVAAGRREEEEKSAKRELLEGNFGLKIQPSQQISLQSGPPKGSDGTNDIREQGMPQKQYGPPAQFVTKISDLLSGQSASYPAAIESHLYSPVSIYQPRLSPPMSFEVSQPVPSQLAYSEHKIYQANSNIQNINENLQALNQNVQPSQQPSQFQQPQVQFNFPAFPQLQPPRGPPGILSDQFLPRLGTPGIPPRPDLPPQIYQQVFSSQSGGIPQDIYQQINQLGNQIPYEETLQISQESEEEVEEKKNRDSGSVKQQDHNIRIQFASQTQQQDHKTEEKEKPQQQQSFNQQGVNSQAVSYASFSQSFPISSESRDQSQVAENSLSLQPQQQKENLQPQSSPLFQPEQQRKAQSVFQPIGTTPAPTSTLYTVANQTPKRIGVVRLKQELTTPQPLSISALEPQVSSTSSVLATDNTQPSTTEEHSTTRFFTPQPTRSRLTFRPLSTLTPRTTLQPSSFPSRSTFASRPTLPALHNLPRRQQVTSQTLSTLPSTIPSSTLTPISLIPQTFSTLSPQSSSQTITTLTPTTQPELVTPNLTTLPILHSQPIQPQTLPTLQPLPQQSTLQPFLLTPSQPLSQSDSPAAVRPDLRAEYPIQSEPQSIIQVQEFREKSQQQLVSQPQVQYIEQQLQSIQQQLQQIQQQPQVITQQPQPIQIIQPQNSFPQSVQLIPQQQQPLPQQPQPIPQQQSITQQQQQQQPILQQQPITQQQQPILQQQQQPISQLQQQKPQPTELTQPELPLIQIQPQLIQQESQLVQPHLQLIQPQPQLIQGQPQLIQLQPQFNKQQPQLIQQQPQAIEPQPQFVQPQPQLVQLVQQPQFEPSPQSQNEIQQNAQQKQNEDQNQQQSTKNNEKPEKKDNENTQDTFEARDNYPQLLQSNLYAEELYYQPPHLQPIPVAFPSYHSRSSYPFHSTPLHASPFHTSPLQASSFHDTSSYPSVQYFGKYAPAVFGGWH